MNKFRSLLVVAILGGLVIAGCSVPGSSGGGAGGPVDLGTAGNYAIFAASGVTTTGVTSVTGDIGTTSSASSVSGFTLTMDSSNVFSTSPLVVGNVYAFDYVAPTPTNMTQAAADMVTAYNYAAGLPPAVGPKLNLGAGTISGVTLGPGVYTWTSNLDITTDITISGSATDTWVFQVAGILNLANSANIILSGGALAKNIVWQVAGSGVNLGTSSHFEGTILAKAAISFTNLASINGRALAQTAVTMIATTVVKP